MHAPVKRAARDWLPGEHRSSGRQGRGERRLQVARRCRLPTVDATAHAHAPAPPAPRHRRQSLSDADVTRSHRASRDVRGSVGLAAERLGASTVQAVRRCVLLPSLGVHASVTLSLRENALVMSPLDIPNFSDLSYDDCFVG